MHAYCTVLYLFLLPQPLLLLPVEPAFPVLPCGHCCPLGGRPNGQLSFREPLFLEFGFAFLLVAQRIAPFFHLLCNYFGLAPGGSFTKRFLLLSRLGALLDLWVLGVICEDTWGVKVWIVGWSNGDLGLGFGDLRRTKQVLVSTAKTYQWMDPKSTRVHEYTSTGCNTTALRKRN